MSNHRARTWDHRGSKPLNPKLLPLDYHLDGFLHPHSDLIGCGVQISLLVWYIYIYWDSGRLSTEVDFDLKCIVGVALHVDCCVLSLVGENARMLTMPWNYFIRYSCEVHSKRSDICVFLVMFMEVNCSRITLDPQTWWISFFILARLETNISRELEMQHDMPCFMRFHSSLRRDSWTACA
jgi:hypothetical protein